MEINPQNLTNKTASDFGLKQTKKRPQRPFQPCQETATPSGFPPLPPENGRTTLQKYMFECIQRFKFHICQYYSSSSYDILWPLPQSLVQSSSIASKVMASSWLLEDRQAFINSSPCPLTWMKKILSPETNRFCQRQSLTWKMRPQNGRDSEITYWIYHYYLLLVPHTKIFNIEKKIATQMDGSYLKANVEGVMTELCDGLGRSIEDMVFGHAGS